MAIAWAGQNLLAFNQDWFQAMYNNEQIQASIATLKDQLNLPSIIYAEIVRIGFKYMSGASLRSDEVDILDVMLLLASEPG
jgi:hypothetical protein